MKQKLRLGDSYALLATNHTKHERKRTAHHTPVTPGQRRVSLGYASGIPAVCLRRPWTAESRQCLSHALRIPLVPRSQQTPSSRNPFRTRLGSASEFDANSEPTQSQLEAAGAVRVSTEYTSSWHRVQSHIPSRLRKREGKTSCVCTHAKAPARSGLGLALGMALALLLATICTHGYAQETQIPSDGIVPLKIGDSIPETLWHLPLQVVNHSEGKDTITLDDYRHKKLIILDFWATWCVPCIKSLPKLDELQGRIGAALSTILVSSESEQKVLPFLARHGYALTSVVQENSLKVFFPHASIPYQVWIREGRVLAFPESKYIDEHTIAHALQGGRMDLIMKEQPMDGNPEPVFWDFSSSYGFVLTGRKPGSPSTINISSNGASLQNLRVPHLLREAYADQVPAADFASRVIYELPDSIANRLKKPRKGYMGTPDEDRQYRAWLNENTYCLHFISSEALPIPELREILATELNRAFSKLLGIRVSLETRRLECWVLRSNGQRNTKPVSQSVNRAGRDTVFDGPELVRGLQYIHNGSGMPIIDKTDSNFEGIITIHSNLNDIPAVNRELRAQGFELIREYLPVECVVVSQIN